MISIRYKMIYLNYDSIVKMNLDHMELFAHTVPKDRFLNLA